MGSGGPATRIGSSFSVRLVPRAFTFFSRSGPPPGSKSSASASDGFKEDKGEKNPRIERADQRLVGEIEGSKEFFIEPTRDQFDYVYRSQDLIQLTGRRYHSKRNHINKFTQSYSFTYSPLEERHLKACMELGGRWCDLRRCEEDLNLMGESEAVQEALTHFFSLNIRGGVILIQDKVEAFSLGERFEPRDRIGSH